MLAGEGDERSRLEQMARTLGLAERVRFLGYRPDIPELLAVCDLFVLPSLYEGLPLAVLEAMAASRPVVATAVGGTDEVVTDGESGLLVPPAEPAALTAAIRTILELTRASRDGWVRRARPVPGRSSPRAGWSARSLLCTRTCSHGRGTPGTMPGADLSEARRNRLLRRVDWRYLLPIPSVAKAICLADGDLGEGVALIAAQVVPGAAEAGADCDLAVAVDPDVATLRALCAALQPGGAFYGEWHAGVTGGIRAIAQRLGRAGFAQVRAYLPWRSSSRPHVSIRSTARERSPISGGAFTPEAQVECSPRAWRAWRSPGQQGRGSWAHSASWLESLAARGPSRPRHTWWTAFAAAGPAGGSKASQSTWR